MYRTGSEDQAKELPWITAWARPKVSSVRNIRPIHDQISIEVNPAYLCQDEFLVQMQEEFSNQPVDRTDEMVAIGLLDSNLQ